MNVRIAFGVDQGNRDGGAPDGKAAVHAEVADDLWPRSQQ